MQYFICPIFKPSRNGLIHSKKRLANANAEHAKWKSELLALHKSQESSPLRIEEICKLLDKLDLEIAHVERQIEAFNAQQVR